ncbi:hypothetical protein J4229_00605 [Candidatus Pacearchaeota archaeon]|nr:hypothetical protein [Candidatus Pacearchaeota archaeon]
MIEAKARLRKWGRSFGVVIPMEKIKEANLNENQTITIMITNHKNPFLENFGKIKQKKPVKKILKEIREEGWDE